MANFVIPYLKPVADFWNSLCIDQHQKELFESKGQLGSLGTDWTSRYLRSEQDVHNLEYLRLHKRFTEDPELLDVISDNVWRLTLFAGVERALVVRQAQAILKTQFAGASQSFAGAVQSVLNNGILAKGYLRGAGLNFLQFCGAPYQTLLWTRNANLPTQIAVASIFEAFFYPLDTLKTVLYCDTNNKVPSLLNAASNLVQKGGVTRLYAGLFQKLGFNAALIFHLNSVYDGSALQWVSLPLLALAYPLLVYKTRLQVAGTPVSLAKAAEVYKLKGASTYAGLVPFLIFNTVFAYQFAAWYSPAAQQRAIGTLQAALAQFVSPGAEYTWSN